MGRTARLFEPESQIAYRIEHELGYRDSADTDWHFVSLEDICGRTSRFRPQIAHLDDLVPTGVTVPTLEISPGPEAGEVRLSSVVRIAVHLYGDTSSSVAGREVDVPYGSVARVGPLLVAPLYAEQVESIHDGLLTLPSIGPIGNMEGAEEDEIEPPRSRQWAIKLWGATWLTGFVASAGLGLAACIGLYHPYYSHSASVPTIMVFLVGLFWFWLVITGVPVHRIISDWVQAPAMDPEGLGYRSRRLRFITLGSWYLLWIGAFAMVGVLLAIEHHYGPVCPCCPGETFFTLLNDLIPRWVLVLLLGTPIHFVMSLVVSKMRDGLSQPAAT